MIDETLLLYVIGESEKEFRKKLLSIRSGKFNTENIGSCCGGVCGKQ